jgi:hypothetical protein
MHNTIVKVSGPFYDGTSFRRPAWESLLCNLPGIYAPTGECLSAAYQRCLMADLRPKRQFQLRSPDATIGQKAAHWIELLVEQPLEDWIGQAHKNQPSYSILSMLRDKDTPSWFVNDRGAVVDESLEFTKDPPTSIQLPPAVCFSNELPSHSNSESRPPPPNPSPTPSTSALPLSTNTSETVVAHGFAKSSATPEIAYAEKRIRQLLLETVTNRILFVTEKGYISLVPYHARVGDKTVVHFGGRTPFILREVASGEALTDPDLGPEKALEKKTKACVLG